MDGNERKLFRISDIFIIAAVLAAAAACLLIKGGDGSSAVISADGNVIETIPLEKSGEYRFPEIQGVTFTVENGSVRISENDCGDLICVKTGAVSHKGEAVICMPKKISVEITGGNSNLDAVIQ